MSVPIGGMPIEHRVLRWLLCLPALTEMELAALCETLWPGVREAIHRLHRAGWLFARTLTDPAAPDHVYAVSDLGLTALHRSPEAALNALGDGH